MNFRKAMASSAVHRTGILHWVVVESVCESLPATPLEVVFALVPLFEFPSIGLVKRSRANCSANGIRRANCDALPVAAAAAESNGSEAAAVDDEVRLCIDCGGLLWLDESAEFAVAATALAM